MPHKANKDLRKEFSSQKMANSKEFSSPIAEIGHTRLESNVGTPRVSGDNEEIRQNSKNESQDDDEQFEHAEVDGDELDAAMKRCSCRKIKEQLPSKMSKR